MKDNSQMLGREPRIYINNYQGDPGKGKGKGRSKSKISNKYRRDDDGSSNQSDTDRRLKGSKGNRY